MKPLLTLFFAGFLSTFAFAQDKEEKKETPKPAAPKAEEVTVIMSTSEGDIHIQLDSAGSPLTVKNFLSYLDDKFYDGTVFHRVIANFMIQGGGFSEKEGKLTKKDTKPPVKNESSKSAPNTRGTIAMARTSDADSATSQFFINVTDNEGLNYPLNGGGYTTFGKVTKGMDIVDKIKAVETGFSNGMGDVPKKAVLIKSIKRAK